jgi:hypothetical protein
MAGITDLIEIFRGETINLNPFKKRRSASMNPGGKLQVGKYATTSLNEAANYASSKFPNVIKTTKITPRDFKIGRRVFNEVTPDFSDRPNIIKKVNDRFRDFTRDRSGRLGYNILSSKNKGKLEVDVLKTFLSNAKALTPLAMKGLNILASLPAATATMFLQSTPANADEANMQLEDFAKLAEENNMQMGSMDKSLETEQKDI